MSNAREDFALYIRRSSWCLRSSRRGHFFRWIISPTSGPTFNWSELLQFTTSISSYRGDTFTRSRYDWENILAPADIPIGVVTSIIGSPYLIYMLLTRKTAGYKIKAGNIPLLHV